MRVSIFGMGYVGMVSAACMASDGHEITGVDPSLKKVDLINRGVSPIIEKDIGELLAHAVSTHRIRAVSEVDNPDDLGTISFVCVGTPSALNGSLDLRHVRTVCEQIGILLRSLDSFHVIAIRSTMLPGSMRSTVIPTLEEYSGKQAGSDFGICIVPEFLREGSAVADYRNPSRTVVGATDARSGRIVAEIFSRLPAPVLHTSLEVAEATKYVDNIWHATKVVFANEIGTLCKQFELDSREVMDIFFMDTRLNISPSYLKPGFAFGGSCLPKDVRAILHKATMADLQLPLLGALLPSNDAHIKRAIQAVLSLGRHRIGVYGMAFKAGTDDLRESPVVSLVEFLLGKGLDVRIYDSNVSTASLTGGNRDFALNHLPHLSRLLVRDSGQLVEHSEVLILAVEDSNAHETVRSLPSNGVLIDLVGIPYRDDVRATYCGLCW